MSEPKQDDEAACGRSDSTEVFDNWTPLTPAFNALQKDAERYRWLRSRVWANDPNIFSIPVLVGVNGANLLKGSVAQHFDEVIDIKMKVANDPGNKPPLRADD